MASDTCATEPLYDIMAIRRLYLGGGWWNLASMWDDLLALGNERDQQKKQYASTRNWSTESTHFLGLVAEQVFSLETGINLDTVLRVAGDGGKDFEYDSVRFDIKGTQYYRDPHLKQNRNAKHWADCFVLAGINVPAKQGRIFGWETRETLQAAPFVDYGYGQRHSLSAAQLLPGLPDFLPSLRTAYGIGD